MPFTLGVGRWELIVLLEHLPWTSVSSVLGTPHTASAACSCGAFTTNYVAYVAHAVFLKVIPCCPTRSP